MRLGWRKPIRSAAAPATVGVEARTEATDLAKSSGRRCAAVKRQPGDLPSPRLDQSCRWGGGEAL